MQGEYVLPSSTTVPRSVKPVPKVGGKEASRPNNPFEEGAGRWRLQVRDLTRVMGTLGRNIGCVLGADVLDLRMTAGIRAGRDAWHLCEQWAPGSQGITACPSGQ